MLTKKFLWKAVGWLAFLLYIGFCLYIKDADMVKAEKDAVIFLVTLLAIASGATVMNKLS
ncbi:hypothetical protein KC926_00450 [Candidatus Kaiserbacteria bacterium]|nr:hypothetical protein [Candidatus Kaiserbacteria bacterium]